MKTIITIGRQFGSGGKEIGIRVAKELGIPFYDKELLQEAAKKSGLCEKIFENFDERPKSLLYSIAMDSYMFALPGSGVGDSLEQQVYLATFNTIRHIADQGPCVIIGRCADYALADYPNHLSLFISAPLEVRIQRVAQRQNLTPADPQDRQAPGVLLRVLFLQEVGQCGQLPLLHRFQLSGPGPDRGADPGHGGPQGASDPQPHGGGSHPSPDVSAAKHGGTGAAQAPVPFSCSERITPGQARRLTPHRVMADGPDPGRSGRHPRISPGRRCPHRRSRPHRPPEGAPPPASAPRRRRGHLRWWRRAACTQTLSQLCG